MKFLIQKINNQIRHDFSFALIESARFYNWLHDDSRITLRYLNTIDIVEPSDIYPPFDFKNYHYNQKFVPIGSVDFVNEFLAHFYGFVLKPTNVPEELFHYASREICNGTEESFGKLNGKYFFKSNDLIKGHQGYYDTKIPAKIPDGNYQISEYITNILSEWRGFVYAGKLVGLQNYSGDFTKWPNMNVIRGMINLYKSAPIAYTLDIGISENRGTFVIECHPFVSCGLYGMSEHKILPYMFYKCFLELIQKEGNYEKRIVY